MYFNAMMLHRWGHKLHERGIPVLPRLMEGMIFLLFNSSIPITASVGPGTVCQHRGIGVVINADALIGNRVRIGPHVVIGGLGQGKPGAPRIGNDVWLTAGAIVLGPVDIGDGSVVAAGAVVLDDVPPNSVVAGVPARVVRTQAQQ